MRGQAGVVMEHSDRPSQCMSCGEALVWWSCRQCPGHLEHSHKSLQRLNIAVHFVDRHSDRHSPWCRAVRAGSDRRGPGHESQDVRARAKIARELIEIAAAAPLPRLVDSDSGEYVAVNDLIAAMRTRAMRGKSP